MEKQQSNIKELLKFIDPSTCNYQEWVNVGMALKEEGFFASDWEDWSRSDGERYHEGECYMKWASFQGTSNPVTGGTIYQMAVNRGYVPPRKDNGPGHELSWDDEINDERIVVEKGWVEDRPFYEPKTFDRKNEIIRYLEALFESSDYVGYVTNSYESKDGRFLPSKGNYDRTCGELITALEKTDDISEVFGDYNKQAGAWIRFNPLDGKGVTNSNVSDYRYALIESDTMELSKQNALVRELELPIAALVYSGKKSVHAIVRIEAQNYSEYKKRVEYLYDVCQKNGLMLDIQNKNPSRLSRFPGFERRDKKQFIIDTNIGKSGWNEWKEWIESVNDDLPEFESLEDTFNDLPPLADELIEGVLRKGHKMLISGPSKAGKSFALIELSIALAEGTDWFGWHCSQGRVLYVNLELDRTSCLHRFHDVYETLGIPPKNIRNIDIWNLRGRSVPMDKLAPKLIRRAQKKQYEAIIIDPIYKVITGDENSADQMANFCNQFDKICTELNSATIYCHHHSKGSQGGKKSMDRASGSGVFARDPDALVDLIELDLTDKIKESRENEALCKVCASHINMNKVEDSDRYDYKKLLEQARLQLSNTKYGMLLDELNAAKEKVSHVSAWRLDGTLREFPKFAPKNVWFDYPIHTEDKVGVLKDIQLDDGSNSWKKTWKKNFQNKKTPEEASQERIESFDTAFSGVSEDGKASIQEMAEYMGVSEKTIRRRAKESKKYWVEDSYLVEK